MSYKIIQDGSIQAGTAVVVGGWKWVTGAIPANEISVVVTHNLGNIPAGYSLVDNNEYAVGKVYVERADILANTATIKISSAQPVDADFMFGVTT